jgi:serine/threonine-protein kinase
MLGVEGAGTPIAESADVSPATFACVPPSSGAERSATETCFAGRYRIDSVLGSGGMGVVYAATHLELGVPLALKILHPSLTSSPEARARFCIEARASAALSSPHTLRIYDAGLLGSEECFIVMERLVGRNLFELLHAEGPLPSTSRSTMCCRLAPVWPRRMRSASCIVTSSQKTCFWLSSVVELRWSRSWTSVSHAGGAQRGRGQRITNPRSNVGSPAISPPNRCKAQPAWMSAAISGRWIGLVRADHRLLPVLRARVFRRPAGRYWMALGPSLLAARLHIDPGLERVFQRCVALDPTQRFRSVSHLAAALRPFAKPAGSASGIRPLVEPLPAEPVTPAPAARLRAVALGGHVSARCRGRFRTA